MTEQKKTYYIKISNGEISQQSTASPWDYKIEATDTEITRLREYFDQVYSTDMQSFLRSHVPYVEYHYDSANDAIDETNEKIFKMVYQLGDEEAKKHIATQGLVGKIEEKSKEL